MHRFAWALAALIVVPSAAAAPASLAGLWKTDDGKGIVAMTKCGAKMCGRIAELLIKEPDGRPRDERNPDKTKRGRMVEGLQLYWDLVPPEGGWGSDTRRVGYEWVSRGRSRGGPC